MCLAVYPIVDMARQARNPYVSGRLSDRVSLNRSSPNFESNESEVPIELFFRALSIFFFLTSCSLFCIPSSTRKVHLHTNSLQGTQQLKTQQWLL